MPDAVFASRTAALQQFETASAEARAATDVAMDVQLILAKARLSGDGASPHADTASAAEPGPAAEHDAEAGGGDVQQELLEQRQSMDAVLGELSCLLAAVVSLYQLFDCLLHSTQVGQSLISLMLRRRTSLR